MNVDYSNKLKRIPSYLFAEIDRAIEKKKKEGKDIINLSVGDPDLPAPKRVVDALCKAARDPRNHRYPSYAGMLEFRKAVAKWYKLRFNVSLDAEKEVIALIGSKDGITHIHLAFLNPGDKVLVPDPGYPAYKSAVILADGTPVEMPLLKENDFKPDLSSIDRKIAKETKMLFINYPNAPTTAVADKEFFKEVVDFALDNEIMVCHDNPYSEITFDNYKAPSFLEVRNAKDVGIEFHSLSKSFNMTGFRIGMAVGNEAVISGLGKVKENVDSGVFQPIQIAAIEALENCLDEIKKNVKIFEERRDVMVDSLNDFGWEVDKPKATFYLWAEIPKGFNSSIKFCSKVLEETGVVLTPGVGLGKFGEGYVRFALTQSKEKLKEAAERLGKFIKKLK